jgi:hypothetical protein
MSLLAATALAVAPAATGAPPAAAAATVRVNTTLDETQTGNGTCSLRDATLYASGTAEPDCAPAPASGTTTIIVPAGVYALTGGALSLTGDAAIVGAGAGTTTINAGGMSQVLGIAGAAHVSITGVTVTGGQSGAACTGNMCIGLGLPVSGFPGGGIVNAATLALTGVVVTGNRTGAGATNPTCTINNSGCSAGDGGDGGGISNTGTLTIADSTITGNSTGPGGNGSGGGLGPIGGTGGGGGNSGNGGNGGGISNSGTLTITNSTISDNTAGAGASGAPGGNGTNGGGGGGGSNGGTGGNGGGIENTGRLVISASTFAGNHAGPGGEGGPGGDASGQSQGGTGGLGGAGGSGGAIDSTADMTISNSTAVGNTSVTGGATGRGGFPNGLAPGPGQPGNGGAIAQRAMGSTLTHVTLTANSASGVGGGVDGAGGTVTVANSIIAGNVAAAPNLNCAGVLTDQGGNIEFAATSCPAGFLRSDPKLTGLADNGGPTETISLQPGSAAIDHVPTCVLTTDQRGVGRPVGSPCDSGAYQVAPPSVSGVSAGAITTTAATLAASVNPNLQDATVVVNYGRTMSYGSSTAPRDLGAGNVPSPFAAALGGLTPNTRYHFQVVATNADGRTVTSDGVFTTLPPLTASIARASTSGPALSLTIACGGGSGPGTCAGKIRLTSRVATKHAHGRRAKRTKTVTVAAGTYSVGSGSRVTVRLKLNRNGRGMLSENYSLATTVTLGGTTALAKRVTFRYPVIKSDVTFTFSFNHGPIVASVLTVTGVPRGGKVSVICHGGGCPFAVRGFQGRHGQLALAPMFQHAALQLGTSIQIEVAAANRVAKVETLTLGSGPTVFVTKLCLPPGARRPARCVSTR